MADEPPPLDVEGSPPPPGDEELSEDNIFGKPLLDEPEPAKEERKEKKGKWRTLRGAAAEVGVSPTTPFLSKR